MFLYEVSREEIVQQLTTEAGRAALARVTSLTGDLSQARGTLNFKA